MDNKREENESIIDIYIGYKDITSAYNPKMLLKSNSFHALNLHLFLFLFPSHSLYVNSTASHKTNHESMHAHIQSSKPVSRKK